MFVKWTRRKAFWLRFGVLFVLAMGQAPTKSIDSPFVGALLKDFTQEEKAGGKARKAFIKISWVGFEPRWTGQS